MNNLIVKKLLTSLLYVVLAVVLECFLFSALGWGLFPVYFGYDLAVILLFAVVIFGAKTQKTSTVILIVLVAFQALVSYTNICVFYAMNDIFSINMLWLVGETANVITLEMFPWVPLLFIGIVFSVMIVSLNFLKKIPVEKKHEQKFSHMFFRIVVLFFATISISVYSFQTSILKSTKDEKLYLLGDNYLFNTFSSGKLALEKFGTFGFYIEDFSRLVIQPESLKKTTQYDIEKYLSTNEYNPKNSPLWNAVSKDGDDNIIVIMLESFEWYAISPEITPLLYALANGYDIGTNEMAALYDMYEFYYDEDDVDQKLLKVARKDFERTIVNGKVSYVKDEDVEIYDSSKELSYGLTLLNYYSKAKTDYSEASCILGNYPYNQSFTVRGGIGGFRGTNLYEDINYSFTLPNALKNSGYIEDGQASYFHTYMAKFYGRNELLPQFGFDSTMFYEDFIKNDMVSTGDRLSHAVLDSEILSLFMNEFLHLDEDGNPTSDDPFLSFLTTVTTHGEYTTYNQLLKENYAFLDSIDYLGKDTDEATSNPASIAGQIRTYLAGIIDTEQMVALLLNALIQKQMLQNTTLVFFADHQAYYSGLDMNYKSYYYSDEEDYSQFRSDWYASLSDTGTYSKYSSERYAVPSFIWSMALDEDVTGSVNDGDSTVKYQYVEKFTCAFDLLPTIFTMCGIEYNTNYYLGYPVMCTGFDKNNEPVELGTLAIISHTGGYFNDRFFSEDGLEVKYAVSGTTPQEKLAFSYSLVKQLEKWYLITALYKYDAFEKVPLRI